MLSVSPHRARWMLEGIGQREGGNIQKEVNDRTLRPYPVWNAWSQAPIAH